MNGDREARLADLRYLRAKGVLLLLERSRTLDHKAMPNVDPPPGVPEGIDLRMLSGRELTWASDQAQVTLEPKRAKGAPRSGYTITAPFAQLRTFVTYRLRYLLIAEID